MKGVKHRAGNDPRAAALLVLNEVLTGVSDSQAVLDRQLTGSSLVPGDKALCTELVYGVLRRHLRLEWFIRQMLDKPDKLPPEMLLVLELAAYELAFTRIPAHASVNWAVGFIRNRFGQGLSRVGNGVLRRFERGLRDEFENPLYYLRQLKLEAKEGAAQISGSGYQVSNRELSDHLSEEKAVDGRRRTDEGSKCGSGVATPVENLSASAQDMNGASEGGCQGKQKPGSVLDYSDDPRFLAVYYGMPEWIVRLWLEACGPEAAEAYLAASALAAPVGVRLNPLAPGYKSLLNEMLQEEDAQLVPPAAVALLGGARRPVRFAQREGRLSRQSAASYQALWQLDPKGWEQPIWDACAGRGGKTLALLEQGIPVALLSDSSKARLKGFEPDFNRLFAGDGNEREVSGKFGTADGKRAAVGSETSGTVAWDAPARVAAPSSAVVASVNGGSAIPSRPELFFGPAEKALDGRLFGTIILDVPCSGLGTLAHRPEIRWRRSPKDLERLCASQQALLENALRALKKGGRIVYLTCTVNPAENENRIKSFLEAHQDFKLEKSWQTPPDSRLNEFFWGAVLKQEA